MFKYKVEEELQNHIINNFNNFFNFDFVDSEVRVRGGRIDLLGKDNNTIYIVELKRDIVIQSTLTQLDKYITAYKTDKNIIGIAAAPTIREGLDFELYNNKIITMKLEGVECEISSMKTILLNLPIELHKELRKESFLTNVSMNSIMIKAIKEKLAKEDK